MTPEVFLSHHQIAYNKEMGDSPAEIVENLKILNDNRAPIDFDHIAKKNSSVGRCARFIASARLKFAETGATQAEVFATDAKFDDLQIIKIGCWFDTQEAEDALDEYEFPAAG